MKNAVSLILLCLALFSTVSVYAQNPSVNSVSSAKAFAKCDGPPDLCARIAELQALVETNKATGQKNLDQLAKEKKEQETTMKLIAAAGVIAAVLKALLSALSGWKDYFKTTKGKAWVRVITLVVGFLAFVFTNIGFGIPWWQSLIVAGGGPGAILLHELMKLGPAIQGKGPLPPETDPANPLGTTTETKKETELASPEVDQATKEEPKKAEELESKEEPKKIEEPEVKDESEVKKTSGSQTSA